MQNPDLELRFSRRNRVQLRTQNVELTDLADRLTEKQEQKRGKRYSPSEREQAKASLALLLLDLVTARETHPRLFVGYSASMRAFTKGGAYWNAAAGAPHISRAYYLAAIETLEQEGLAEVRKASAGFSTISSRIRATDKLGAWATESSLNWSQVDLGEGSIIVRRGNEVIDWPDDPTFDPQEALARLRKINTALRDTFLNLNVSDHELERLNLRFEGLGNPDGDDSTEPFDFSNRSLNRIFADGTFAKGGRFYGGWWQGVPSEYRRWIEIDGRVTVELDYSSMQPRLLYAEVGHPAPPDSYLLPNWPTEIRPLVKTLFAQLLNSDPSSSNPNQWHRFAPSLLNRQRAKVSKAKQADTNRKLFKATFGRDYADLIRDVLAFHEPIRAAFFTKAWGRMQRLDSDIAEGVMLRLLARNPPVVALPIHDSFIVGRLDEQAAHAAMLDTFLNLVGAKGFIARDETVFDLPLGQVPHMVHVEDLHLATKDHLVTHRSYHLRELQWMKGRGPVD